MTRKDVLKDIHSSILLVDNKYGNVILASGGSHYPQLQQFFNVLLNSIPLSFQDLELLDVDWIFTLQFNVVHGGGTLSQVILTETDHLMVFQKEINITLPQFLRSLFSFA